MSSSTVNFIYDNSNFDAAALSATFEDADWPIENVQLDDPGVAFKCLDHTANERVVIDVTFDQLRTADVLVFAHHTLHAESIITVRTFSDAARTDLLFEQSFYGYRALFGFGERGFGDGGFGGVLAQEDLAIFPRLTRAFYFNGQQNAQYFQIEVNNAGEIFSIGRIFLATALSPEINYVYGDSFQLQDDTTITYAYAGNAIRNEGERYYEMNFTLSYLTREEAYGEFIRLIKRCGKRKPFIIHRDPDESDAGEPYSIFYGAFTEIPSYKTSKKSRRISTTMTIREEI